MADVPDEPNYARAILHRIADAIGAPVEAFYDAAGDENRELLILLKRWSATTDSQGRHRILSTALREAERCGYVEK